jgi:glyceraldehyde-3-phosphate dehydrogenase (NADP+)
MYILTLKIKQPKDECNTRRIPDKELLNQDTYLVNGELKKGKGKLLQYSPLFHQQKNMHLPYWFYPFYGRNSYGAVEAASAAYNKDRDLPTMSGGSYQMHGKFVTQMKATSSRGC